MIPSQLFGDILLPHGELGVSPRVDHRIEEDADADADAIFLKLINKAAEINSSIIQFAEFAKVIAGVNSF